MNIQTIRQKLERQKGSRDQVSRDLKKSQETIRFFKQEISYSEEAQAIIAAVAKSTQNELSYRITEPVSLALSAVFGSDAYKMSAVFNAAARGATECVLGFERNGNIVDPLSSSGGGTIDIATFALRIGAWSLTQPRSRAVILLDEPGKWVSRNKIGLFGQMMRETSSQLNLQIILITHIAELAAVADKTFEVTIENGVSKVEEIS